jgi:glycosyltransferase involved in cell wall biosynthesis
MHAEHGLEPPSASAGAVETKRFALLLPDLAGGGAERVALAIASYLLERGHRVDLVLVQRRGELLKLVPTGARVIDLGQDRMRASIPPLIAYFRREQPDGLQAFMWPLTIVAVIAHRLARSKVRLILADHGTLSKEYARFPGSLMLRSTLRAFYPHAHARIAVSHGAAADMARVSGLPRQAFEVIPNPVMLPTTSITDPTVEALWGSCRERILSVGGLKPVKNHALLLTAFARLRQKRPAARLMILGEGDERPKLGALAKSFGIEQAVLLPGFALNPSPYLASADLFVLSSDSEASPLVLVEALNAGLRIVSTDCENGPREILEAGRFGRLAPVGDPDALAAAMDQGLAEQPRPVRQRCRAAELAAVPSLRRYEELMLGAERLTTPASLNQRLGAA